MQLYCSKRHELSVKQGCLLREIRIIVPLNTRVRYLRNCNGATLALSAQKLLQKAMFSGLGWMKIYSPWSRVALNANHVRARLQWHHSIPGCGQPNCSSVYTSTMHAQSMERQC